MLHVRFAQAPVKSPYINPRCNLIVTLVLSEAEWPCQHTGAADWKSTLHYKLNRIMSKGAKKKCVKTVKRLQYFVFWGNLFPPLFRNKKRQKSDHCRFQRGTPECFLGFKLSLQDRKTKRTTSKPEKVTKSNKINVASAPHPGCQWHV